MTDWKAIRQKVENGDRLSFDDGVELFRSNDIVSLGRLANTIRERLNSDLTFYNVNRHINYTNVCAIDCQLCQGAYARKPGQEGGYTMQLEQVFRFAEQEYSDSLTEFHIVGGLNPELPFDYYLELLRGLKHRFPSVHLKAFTMVELDFFTKITRKPLEWVIAELHGAGMGSCPGGDARNIFGTSAPADCRSQNFRRSMARCCAKRAQGRYPFQCNDALRAHRNPRRTCRSSGPAAAVAG